MSEDVNYVENARRLADAMSAHLTDKAREKAMANAVPAARTLLDLAKDQESACILASSFARLTSILTMTAAGDLSATLDAFNATYALAAGITAGSIPMPASKDDPVQTFADPDLIKVPADETGEFAKTYLKGPYL